MGRGQGTLSSRGWPVPVLRNNRRNNSACAAEGRRGHTTQRNATALLPFPCLLPWCCASPPALTPCSVTRQVWRTRAVVLKMETTSMKRHSKDMLGCSPGSPDGPTMLAQQPCEAALGSSTDQGETHYFLPLLRSPQRKAADNTRRPRAFTRREHTPLSVTSHVQ